MASDRASLKAQIGVSAGEARSHRPERGSTAFPNLFGAFGEANPATVSDTPRTVQNTPAKAEPIHGKPLVVANGWIDRPNQTGGMSVLMVDQLQTRPDAEIRGITQSAINHSRYVPAYHVKNAWWLYSRWDPIFRYANTAMDVRWKVGHIAPAAPGSTSVQNVPGTAIMGPYAAPYRTAYQIPRFSTEPNTIIPQGSR